MEIAYGARSCCIPLPDQDREISGASSGFVGQQNAALLGHLPPHTARAEKITPSSPVKTGWRDVIHSHEHHPNGMATQEGSSRSPAAQQGERAETKKRGRGGFWHSGDGQSVQERTSRPV